MSITRLHINAHRFEPICPATGRIRYTHSCQHGASAVVNRQPMVSAYSQPAPLCRYHNLHLTPGPLPGTGPLSRPPAPAASSRRGLSPASAPTRASRDERRLDARVLPLTPISAAASRPPPAPQALGAGHARERARARPRREGAASAHRAPLHRLRRETRRFIASGASARRSIGPGLRDTVARCRHLRCPT
jgi:hypothetical protein